VTPCSLKNQLSRPWFFPALEAQNDRDKQHILSNICLVL
jgi:hypothetical protein